MGQDLVAKQLCCHYTPLFDLGCSMRYYDAHSFIMDPVHAGLTPDSDFVCTVAVNKKLTFSLRLYDRRTLHAGAKNDTHTLTSCGAERARYLNGDIHTEKKNIYGKVRRSQTIDTW